MRSYESTDEIDRSCNDCGATDWREFESRRYSGDRNDKIAKTWVVCESCDGEGKLFEEGGSEQWTGVLR